MQFVRSLFDYPYLFHHILSLSNEEIQTFGITLFKKFKQSKCFNKDFMYEVWFLLRKGFDPNTYITTTEQKFDYKETNIQKMFTTKENVQHCFDIIIDWFEEYENFEEEALIYFYLCGVDLELPCIKGKNLTLREKINQKWDEFENFEDIKDFSFSYILNILDVSNPNRYGIDLENKKFLLHELDDNDRLRCIKMFSNTLVTEYTLEEAIKVFNLELVAKSEDLKVEPEIIKFLMERITNRAAYETLLLLCNRMITLSSFDIRSIPETKRDKLVEIYKKPMYISNKKYKDEMFKLYFGTNNVPDTFIDKLIKDEKFRDSLIERYRTNNKNWIISKNTNLLDIHLGTRIEIANETDILSENVFDYPPSSIFVERRGNTLYIFTCSDVKGLQNGLNPYTNDKLTVNIPTLENNMNISEFLEEMINGKKISNQNINQQSEDSENTIVVDFSAFDGGNRSLLSQITYHINAMSENN